MVAPSSLVRMGIHALSLLFTTACWVPAASGQSTLLPPLYKRFPTGTIKPYGWSLDQAHIQADGLAGHMKDWYTYVVGSIWIGGPMEYSEMHEAAPYWFNGIVPLAFQLQDARLIAQARSFLDYVLDHQQADGWIGPEPYVPGAAVPRLVWPRYLVLMGLIQYAEADPSQTVRIVDSIHRFATLARTIWLTGQQGSPSMGFQFDYQYVRWEELVYSLQWLYDNYPRGKEADLLETMRLVRNSGYSWKNDWFTAAAFPKVAVTSFNQHTHGVNIGEALKSEALAYRFTQDPTDVQSTFNRIDMLYRYHGHASGTYSADEHLAGLDPSRGTELCAVVEQIFSLAIIYQTFGNNSVADRVEKLAYNALPAGIMHDWWSHQYDQQVNQVWAKNMTPEWPWGLNSGYSNVFGLEPNYPCCTVNHPQAYPKFWAHSFFANQAGNTLIHAFLGPSTISTTLTGSNNVQVTVDTLYPFGSTLTYTVSAAKPFTLSIRIPSWAQNSALSTIAVGSAAPQRVTPNQATSLQAVQLPAGASTVRLVLNMPLQVSTLSGGSVVVNRGPLNYAVQLPYSVTSTLAWRNPQAANDVKRLFPNTPAEYLTTWDSHAHDYTLQPSGEWRIAIDPGTIVVKDNTANTPKMPYYAWAPGSQPVTMTARACQIAWGIVKGTASAPPASPNTCVGAAFEVTLAPFGAAKLRIGEIPTVDL